MYHASCIAPTTPYTTSTPMNAPKPGSEKAAGMTTPGTTNITRMRAHDFFGPSFAVIFGKMTQRGAPSSSRRREMMPVSRKPNPSTFCA